MKQKIPYKIKIVNSKSSDELGIKTIIFIIFMAHSRKDKNQISKGIAAFNNSIALTALPETNIITSAEDIKSF
jgi:hypothetical protein